MRRLTLRNLIWSKINISLFLRLLSAFWSAVIILVLALVFDEEKNTALVEFFYISLICFASTGFSSFTLTRLNINSIRPIELIGLALSSSIVFILFALVIGPDRFQPAHAVIATSFLLREIFGYYLRRANYNATAVIVREHVWRIAFIVVLLIAPKIWHLTALANLFVVSSAISVLFESMIFAFSVSKNRLFNKDPLKLKKPWTRLTACMGFDILGKIQSLSIAIVPIMLVTSYSRFDTVTITLFILVERSSRPIGLIVSQALLDFQKLGSKLVQLRQFSIAFVRRRKLFLIGGIVCYILLLMLYILVYDTKINMLSFISIWLFHTYVIIFNILNFYIIVNRSIYLSIIRVSISLSISILLFNIENLSLEIIVFVFAMSLMLQDVYFILNQKRKQSVA